MDFDEHEEEVDLEEAAEHDAEAESDEGQDLFDELDMPYDNLEGVQLLDEWDNGLGRYARRYMGQHSVTGEHEYVEGYVDYDEPGIFRDNGYEGGGYI